jgi:hypothetical protein
MQFVKGRFSYRLSHEFVMNQQTLEAHRAYIGENRGDLRNILSYGSKRFNSGRLFPSMHGSAISVAFDCVSRQKHC